MKTFKDKIISFISIYLEDVGHSLDNIDFNFLFVGIATAFTTTLPNSGISNNTFITKSCHTF